MIQVIVTSRPAQDTAVDRERDGGCKAAYEYNEAPPSGRPSVRGSLFLGLSAYIFNIFAHVDEVGGAGLAIAEGQEDKSSCSCKFQTGVSSRHGRDLYVIGNLWHGKLPLCVGCKHYIGEEWHFHKR
jgi:hypothetical protein